MNEDLPHDSPVRRPNRVSHDVRETVESLVLAFTLAFLFRTFGAEAYVIPTGSMAPTLMGRHKDVLCPECGAPVRVNAAGEADNQGRRLVDTRGEPLDSATVVGGLCGQCRFPMALDSRKGEAWSYNGDRILATKFGYASNDPARWDVLVFKYPEDAAEHYIKRVVGLPGEWVRIRHGDLWRAAARAGSKAKRPVGGGAGANTGDLPDDSEFQILRKPPRKIRAMAQVVYDHNFEPARLIAAGWPRRWQARDANGHFRAESGGRFGVHAPKLGEAWLDYVHVPPTPDVWQVLDGLGSPGVAMTTERNAIAGESLADHPACRPQLVSDFCAYNTARFSGAVYPRQEMLGLHWVGDLIVEFDVRGLSRAGALVIELVEGDERFQCSFNLAKNECHLSVVGQDAPLATARRVFHPGASAERWRDALLAFANVDDQLHVWVDGRPLALDRAAMYSLSGTSRPSPEDLRPARLGVVDGAELEIANLRLFRDVYYIATSRQRVGSTLTDFSQTGANPSMPRSIEALLRLLSEPEAWSAFEDRATVDFPLGSDEFLMLGDNSPHSSDSRLWRGRHAIARELLVGKALSVYWPHAWETEASWAVPGREVRLPFYPNFRRMGAIR